MFFKFQYRMQSFIQKAKSLCFWATLGGLFIFLFWQNIIHNISETRLSKKQFGYFETHVS